MMRHHLHMPSYFLGTFTEYPFLLKNSDRSLPNLRRSLLWYSVTHSGIYLVV